MNRNALIIGINQYESRSLNNLRLPAKDAEAVAVILEEYGDFRITRLPETINNNRLEVGNSKITVSDLKTALVQLFKPESQQVPDTALFYFLSSPNSVWERDKIKGSTEPLTVLVISHKKCTLRQDFFISPTLKVINYT